MHLAINATEIGRQRGGNESHLLGLLQGFRDLGDDLRLSLLISEAGASSPLVMRGPWQVINVGAYRRVPFLLWQQTQVLRRLRPDWYLSTYFLPPILPCRGAVIVHDLSFRAHPGYFPPSVYLYMTLLTARAVCQADSVLVDSEFTRREMQRFHPAASGKVAPIWNGVGDGFCAYTTQDDDLSILAEHQIQRPYVLAIGNIHPRKNLARLLQAYLTFREEVDASPEMVWVGLPRWQSAELVQAAVGAGVRLTGYVPAEHLPALYRQASAFVYPSLYEGFGLPVIEAMACGTPVICSNTTSVPEVAGDAALLVDPEDTRAIADALCTLWRDPALAAELRRRGLERAQRFTWRRTSRLLLDALAQATG